jgi:hypothetical protein
VHQVLNIGTGRRPRKHVWKLLWRSRVGKGRSTPLRHGRLWLGWTVCIIHDIINYMIYAYTHFVTWSVHTDMSCQVCGIIYFHWQSSSPWINSRDSGPRE